MKTLAIYLMCGPETPVLAQAAVQGGADLVELGSDLAVRRVMRAGSWYAADAG